ncbi:hypothetical protein OHV13_34205 [Kitasatospora purpeofusca]|uniref:hypothetical protein n=1 Tax=Kitasatospora purpeofusca TaxID=67352 RepID=UPI0032541779
MSVTLNPTVLETFQAAIDTLADQVLAIALLWDSDRVMGPVPVTMSTLSVPQT